MSRNAIIAGATGLVGAELLKLLIKSQSYDKILVLNRKEVKFDSPKVIGHVIDFDKLDEFDPGVKIDDVFCCLGTTIKKAKTKENFRKVDFDYVVGLAKKSKDWNASKFLVISSLGANTKSGIFYSRVKGEMENTLQKLDLPHLFIFRPSLLMGDRNESRPGEKTAIMVYKVINPLFFGKLKKYKGIKIEKVAKAIIETAIHSEDTFKIFESDEIQGY
ncbi:MAG: oxidoreductase [Bacteroidales bacterium]|nr:oxidoreductase [Bacteroidales bacterium]